MPICFLNLRIDEQADCGVSPEILAASIREMMEKEEIGGVGVGVPGVVLEDGRITLTTNLQQLEGFSLRDYLQGALQTPVLVENDGNVAGLAEAVAGRGKGYESTYYITVSTGIGGAFVQNGRIFRGKSGFAGEIGSMIVHLSGESYRGLYPGMIEGIASGDALKSRGEQALLTDFSREFPRPLRRWDESASVVRCGYVLCNHIATADKQCLQRTDTRGII